MATLTAYNSPVFNDYWNVIKNWSSEWKKALVSKILLSDNSDQQAGASVANHAAKVTAKPVSTDSMRHYDIDDIAGILACDASDEELLDEYLAEKYGL